MKKRKKLVILTISIAFLFCISITVYNLSLNKKVIMSSHNTKENNNMISFLLETGMKTKQYKESTDNAWPEKYTLNKTLSKCENGGRLEFDENNSMVSLKTKSSDKCYVYFDYPIPDIYVDTTNIPTTYGALANLSCNGATSTYNEKYQRIEISQLSTKNASCNLNYTNRTSKTYLNDYIMGLSGTTQGTGQLVHETFSASDYTNADALTKSEYGTTSQYYSDSSSSTSGTTITNAFSYSGSEWVSQPSKLTSDRYYHINFTVPTSGGYQFCYEMSSGSYNNRLFLFEENSAVTINFSSWISSSSTASKSGCMDLGYISSGTSYRVVQRAYTTISTVKFSLKKANSTQTVDTGYRYEGKNPNNYIWFNNELWRVIGVFDENTHGVSSTNLVKIVRANSIGGLVWDKSSKNDWSNSSLYNLLNGAYYNKQNGNGNAYCYTFSFNSNIPGNCDYSNIGIDASYRGMIKQVTWKIGGHTTNRATAATFYTAERGSVTGNSNGYAATKSGYIGLMYPSDCGYSVLASSCSRRGPLDIYGNKVCMGQSWLEGQGMEWTLTPVSSSNYNVFNLSYTGSISNAGRPFEGFSVRPSLYLDSSVYRISGTGLESDPYIIGM